MAGGAGGGGAALPVGGSHYLCIYDFVSLISTTSRDQELYLFMVRSSTLLGLLVIVFFSGCSDKYRAENASRTPLKASITGDIELLKQLDKEGSDLNRQYPDHFNWTPLIASIYFQNRDIIGYLIDREVDVTKQDATGKTALTMAISMDDTNTGALLLRKASQAIKSNEDWTKVWGYVRINEHSAAWRAILDGFLPTNNPATTERSAP